MTHHQAAAIDAFGSARSVTSSKSRPATHWGCWKFRSCRARYKILTSVVILSHADDMTEWTRLSNRRTVAINA